MPLALADSDEYDYEDDGEGAEESSGIVQPLRKIFSLRKGLIRTPSRDSSTGRKYASIVRITSSDPRSSLSSAPIQLDLDAGTSSTITNGVGSDSASFGVIHHTASAARRRRESGRLLSAGNNNSGPVRAASPYGRSTSPLTVSGSSSRHARVIKRQHSKTSQASSPDGRLRAPSSAVSAGGASEEDEDMFYEEDLSPTSILKREPQVYASLPTLDRSDSSASAYDAASSYFTNSNTASPSYPPNTNSVGRLPPGAGYAPSSPFLRRESVHRLGTLTPEQAKAIWPERRSKLIRLREPDWTPFVDVHDRAKERLQAAANVAAHPRSGSPSLSLASEYSSSSKGQNSVTSNGMSQLELDDEFWFERFTPSTAAAGRDWDWRKRRRLRQQAEIAAKAAFIEANEESPLSTLDSNSSTLNGGDVAAPSITNVGLTDVQLQKQKMEQSRKSNGKVAISNGIKPALSISTSSPLLRATLGRPSPQPASPLSKTLRLKRYSSVDKTSRSGSPGATPESPLNGKTGSNGVASSPSQSVLQTKPRKEETANKRERIRRVSESDSKAAEEALSVPSRFSSLTPKMVKRQLMGRRERDAALTAQLLAEADAIATDEEASIDSAEKKAASSSSSSSSFGRQVLGMRKTASSNMLQTNYKELEVAPAEALPRSRDDLWRMTEGGWSSANAYGVAATSPPSSPSTARTTNGTSSYMQPSGMPRSASALPSHVLNYSGADNDKLTRQGSKTDSTSSLGSGSSLTGHSHSSPGHSQGKINSKRNIISSASTASLPAQHNGI